MLGLYLCLSSRSFAQWCDTRRCINHYRLSSRMYDLRVCYCSECLPQLLKKILLNIILTYMKYIQADLIQELLTRNGLSSGAVAILAVVASISKEFWHIVANIVDHHGPLCTGALRHLSDDYCHLSQSWK